MLLTPSACATTQVTLATFAERVNQKMGWNQRTEDITQQFRLFDDNPFIWTYHEQFWGYRADPPHVLLGQSTDGTSHLILTHIQPGLSLGQDYWELYGRRFLAAELREGEYPIFHGFLKIGPKHALEGKLLKNMALRRFDKLPVSVDRRIPLKYARPTQAPPLKSAQQPDHQS